MSGGVELNEVIEALKRSNAPTLIVEGRDDYIAFNEFEIENIKWGLTILPVKGRNNVETIIERIGEINHPALAFLLDRDCTIFSSPQNHLIKTEIFFTDGYAIENDLIRDGNIMRFLKPKERDPFQTELYALARFFACAAASHIAGYARYPLSTHPRELFGSGNTLLPSFCTFVTSEEPNLDASYKVTMNEPLRYIKGKSLVALFTRHLSHSNRHSKFSGANLLEIGSAARGPFMTQIENNVVEFFKNKGIAPAGIDI